MKELFKIYLNEQSRINLLLNNFLDTKKNPINYYDQTLNDKELSNLVNIISTKLREISISIKGSKYSISYDTIEFNLRDSNSRCFGNQIYMRGIRDTIKVIEYTKIIPNNEYNSTLVFKYCYLIPFLKFIEYYYENEYNKFEEIKDIQIVKLHTFEEAFVKENEGQLFQIGMILYKYENDKLMYSFSNGENWEHETSLNTINQLLRNKFIWVQPKEEK